MNTSAKKCDKCRTHKGKRYCLRNNKHICWMCCNDMRVDTQCPNTCEYTPDRSDPLLLNIKSDSQSELYDCIEEHIKVWMIKGVESLGNQTPMQMKETEAGRKELTNHFSNTIVGRKFAEIYEKLLGINLNSKSMDYKKNFEDIGLEFLQTLGEEKWELAPYYLAPKDPITIKKYISRLKQKKEIRNLSYYIVQASGMSSDGKSAFISVELNHKSDISLLFVEVDGEWRIDNIIFGEINLIYSETDTIKHIANYLSKKEYSRAYQLIKQAEEIYYLSPDIQYNKGLYYSLKPQLNEALKAYAEAFELDVSFAEAVFNQAFIHHSENNLEEAKKLYEKVLTIQKNNVSALNNLGTIYLYEKNYGNAKYYFEQCLAVNPEYQYATDNLKKIEELMSAEQP